MFDDWLFKAQRDKTKLVLVQRMVTRGGRTFPQNFWVRLKKLRPTDKVLSDPNNLLSGTSTTQASNTQTTSTQGTNSQQSNTTGKVVDKTKLVLVQRDVTRDGKTFPKNVWVRLKKLLPTDVVVSDPNNLLTGTQLTATNTVPQNTIELFKLTARWSKDDYDEFAACKTGREKVVFLKKKLGQKNFVRFAELSGVSWTAHSNEAVNNSRAAEALQAYFDSNPGASLVGGGNGGGAPIGNQNAKKDTVAPPDPIVLPDELEVPADASESTKGIIEALNKITDSEVLTLAASTGMVPEDNESREFIEKTLWAEYEKRIGSKPKTGGGYNYPRYSSSRLASDISEGTTKMFKGISKKVIKEALDFYNGTALGTDALLKLVHPRGNVSIGNHNPSYARAASPFLTWVDELRGFSAYGSDAVDWGDGADPSPCNCVGYQGYSTSKSTAEFDLEKEGFVRVLRQIEKTQPELKQPVDDMISRYNHLMELCGYNHEVLKNVVEAPYRDFEASRKRLLEAREAIKLLESSLTAAGYSAEVVRATTSYAQTTYKNDYSSGTRARYAYVFLRDSNGDLWNDNRDDRIKFDITNLSVSSGKSLEDALPSTWGEFNYKTCMITPESELNPRWREISKDHYDEIVQAAYDLAGVKLVDKTTKADSTIKPSEIDSDLYSLNLDIAPNSVDEGLDHVISNIAQITSSLYLKNAIVRKRYKLPDSKANDNGYNYWGNYTYYSPYTIEARFAINPSYSQISDTSDRRNLKTAAEEAAKVDEQLERIKTYSPEYLRKLKEYVENEGDKDFRPSSWSGYPTEIEAKAASLSLKSTGFSISNPTPAQDLLIDQLAEIAQYCPQNYNSRASTPEKVEETARKKLGAQTYQFKDYTPPAPDPSVAQVTSSQLRQLREKALEKAHCTVAYTDQAKRTEVEHTVKMRFDRIDSKTGKRVHKGERVYDDRTLVFHSGVYEVKNHTREKDFQAKAASYGETPETCFHGTGYAGACGIIGVDGKWRYSSRDKVSGQKSCGKMLGDGIYLGKMVGKLCPYIGNDNYSYTRYTAADTKTPGNASDGVILVCDTLFGKHGEFTDAGTARRSNKNEGGTYDSVAVGAGALMQGGARLKEYEMCVTTNDMVLPRYMVDCGGRRR